MSTGISFEKHFTSSILLWMRRAPGLAGKGLRGLVRKLTPALIQASAPRLETCGRR